MKEKMKEEKISDALLKVALGYQVAEVTEEYAEVDGELKLTKRKKTKKDIPPDLKAVQLLLSAENDGSYSGWTDEQLQAERERLLGELQAKQEKETAKKKGGYPPFIRKWLSAWIFSGSPVLPAPPGPESGRQLPAGQRLRRIAACPWDAAGCGTS